MTSKPTIDPRISDPTWMRYQVLSTYNLPAINQELGTNYTTMGDVFRAQREAFLALSPVQRQQDDKAIRMKLGALSSQLNAANR